MQFFRVGERSAKVGAVPRTRATGAARDVRPPHACADEADGAAVVEYHHRVVSAVSVPNPPILNLLAICQGLTHRLEHSVHRVPGS